MARLELYEVRRGPSRLRHHVCLCKSEKDAERIAITEENLSGVTHHVIHVEIIATAELDIEEY